MEDTLTTSLAASAPLFRARRFWGPPALPIDPVRVICGSLACAVKPTQGWRWCGRDEAYLRSRLLSSVFVSWALCDVLRYSDFAST